MHQKNNQLHTNEQHLKSNHHQTISDTLHDLLSKTYSPYSGVNVSAIVVTQENHHYFGINIENMSFSPSVCAERCAIFKAVSEGKRQFKELHLMSSTKKPLFPCGVCLQVMSEFFEKTTPIIVYDKNGQKIAQEQFQNLFPSPMIKGNF